MYRLRALLNGVRVGFVFTMCCLAIYWGAFKLLGLLAK